MVPQPEEEARRASIAAAPTSSHSFTKQQAACSVCRRQEAFEAPRIEASWCLDDGDIFRVAASVPTRGGRPAACAEDVMLQVLEDSTVECTEVVETSC